MVTGLSPLRQRMAADFQHRSIGLVTFLYPEISTRLYEQFIPPPHASMISSDILPE